jgi:hypothetical protein
MIAATKSELDHVWEAALEKIGQVSQLYTMSQIVILVRRLSNKHGFNDFDDLVKMHTRRNGFMVKRLRYGEVDGDNREWAYALDEETRKKWRQAELWDIKKELNKTQALVEAPENALRRGLRIVKNDK